MANKKRNKYPSRSANKTNHQHYVIESGEYNGGASSANFMVSGHSTGSPYSEMEELAEQVTRDAGGIPYRPVEFANGQSDTGYDDDQGEGLGDLGGPEMYGDKPSLLMKSPIHHAGTSRGLTIAAGVGLAATAVLGGLAYFFYRSSKPRQSAVLRSARTKRASNKVTATSAKTDVKTLTQRSRSKKPSAVGKSKRGRTQTRASL